jgi:hypothetical protein
MFLREACYENAISAVNPAASVFGSRCASIFSVVFYSEVGGKIF